MMPHTHMWLIGGLPQGVAPFLSTSPRTGHAAAAGSRAAALPGSVGVPLLLDEDVTLRESLDVSFELF